MIFFLYCHHIVIFMYFLNYILSKFCCSSTFISQHIFSKTSCRNSLFIILNTAVLCDDYNFELMWSLTWSQLLLSLDNNVILLMLNSNHFWLKTSFEIWVLALCSVKLNLLICQHHNNSKPVLDLTITLQELCLSEWSNTAYYTRSWYRS